MPASRYSTIDDYLASQDPQKAATMRAIIETILDRFPETDARLAWNVPHIVGHGAYLFGLSASRQHLTLNPWSTAVLDAFRPRLESDYVVLKTTFQVPVDWPVDGELLADLVQARLAEVTGGA